MKILSKTFHREYYLSTKISIRHKLLCKNSQGFGYHRSGVKPPTITGWLKKTDVREAVLWCKKNGDEFADEQEMKKAKRSGDAYLKIRDDFTPPVTATLPTPYELTNDPEWQEDGELYEKYNLKLDKEDTKPDLPKDEEVDSLPEIDGVLTEDSIEKSIEDHCMHVRS